MRVRGVRVMGGEGVDIQGQQHTQGRADFGLSTGHGARERRGADIRKSTAGEKEIRQQTANSRQQTLNY
jgi:hypothetical protein